MFACSFVWPLLPCEMSLIVPLWNRPRAQRACGSSAQRSPHYKLWHPPQIPQSMWVILWSVVPVTVCPPPHVPSTHRWGILLYIAPEQRMQTLRKRCSSSQLPPTLISVLRRPPRLNYCSCSVVCCYQLHVTMTTTNKYYIYFYI